MVSKVTLRKAKISQGRESLYLDFYPPIRDRRTMKMVYKEYLGIYIFQEPKNPIEREFNNEMQMKAEAIRSIRYQSIVNEEFGFIDKHKKQMDFINYFHEYAKKKNPKWMFVYKHFNSFVNGKCTFGEVDVDLCIKFRDYLLEAKQLKYPDKKISQNSAAGYFSTFRGLLKIAFKEKMLRENINEYLDRIEYMDTKKEFLTKDELVKLALTECEQPVLKKASLFSCITGLRRSDVIGLKWENIVPSSEGGYCMRIRTEKTETEATLPINSDALELCGERSTGKVFKGLTASMTNHPLKIWIKQAGIGKNITFHCFRHTFATLQIALGSDIFTVSKMLTHKNVETTQIYAKLVDEKKRESAERISITEFLKESNLQQIGE